MQRQPNYKLFIWTTLEEATRFRKIKPDFGNAHNAFKAIMDVFERVDGTEMLKSQASAEIGTFMTSDMTEALYAKKRFTRSKKSAT